LKAAERRRYQIDPIFQLGRTEIERTWSRRFGRPEPTKVICVGLNYRDHAIEQRVELPGEPLLFGKFANAGAATEIRSCFQRRSVTSTPRPSSLS
jgi:2-keto-4-pentenoate hydratase/2-oxohepta-3-ene-1,7-dioic acid hydratase in catechol pathway